MWTLSTEAGKRAEKPDCRAVRPVAETTANKHFFGLTPNDHKG
ncbi:hypothetical protein [Spirosoma panaciterrae]|nr:hypothetical protein [Spirosoma panaciterrae]